MTDFQNFNSTTVELDGSNLIEASAGTGKTYSIAILVLRLILEKKISIKEVLMVTFTKAAVAELEERIRLFVRKAYKVSLHEVIDDDIITGLVTKNALNSSESEIQERLKEAVLFLDETAVLTIHSFCQLTLTEFAFETQQLFGADTLKETFAVIEDEVNKFWRENITTIPTDLLHYLIDAGMTRYSIRKVVQEHLKGKRYYNYEPNKTYAYCEEDHQKILNELKEIKKESEKLKSELQIYVQNNEAELRRKSENNTHAKKNGFHLFKSPRELVDLIIGKRTTKFAQHLFTEILSQCDDCSRVDDEISAKSQQVINDINCQAINAVTAGLNDYKQRNNLLSFDDMIVHLHKAFMERDSTNLVAGLQRKYKAVFIDEFQDTDRLQYEIFQKAFANNTILFYIGDPKQSIYAFRKADIFTYFKAKEAVDHRYTMNTNFRSAAPLIDAMNVFFQPQEGFDTFHFNNAAEAISYHPVQSPGSNTKGFLGRKGIPVVPIIITEVTKKDEIYEAVAAQVGALLSDNTFTIVKDGRERAVTPSDIGILVRTKIEGKAIKATLAHYCIPAITIDDARVLQSDEAVRMLYLLEAMIDISRKGINKALLSPFTGYTNREILQLDDEITIGLFRKYRIHWLEDGVYTALMEFVRDFNVKKVLLNVNTENGERIIANLFQLIELVHKVQTNKQFSPLELVSWLKRGIEGMETEGDEYEQRVESDEESVKIITIHKSKGLEYNIVFAPFLDLVENEKIEFKTYRNPVSGEYISIEKEKISQEQEGWVSEQVEQENRRLVYVAITRAVYRCYLHHPMSGYFKESTLAQFINAFQGIDEKLVAKEACPEMNPGYRYREEKDHTAPVRTQPVHFELQHNSWTKMSYTMLAKKGEISSRPASNTQPGKYDHFMFSQLARGNKTGNLLHQVFEYVHFTDDHNWQYVIDEALKQHLPKRNEQYAPMLLEMLKQTLNVKLAFQGESFRLSEVLNENRLHEFEFDFPVPLYNPTDLNMLSGAETDVRVSWDQPLEGIINGKLDLFFECRGKYYILDWKSNYLGDTLQDYSPEAIALAMNENNYHLQYLIYTLAVKKYLRNRLKGFDYEKHFGGIIYLFVRGVRMNGDTGIFFHRPTTKQVALLENIMQGSHDLLYKTSI